MLQGGAAAALDPGIRSSALLSGMLYIGSIMEVFRTWSFVPVSLHQSFHIISITSTFTNSDASLRTSFASKLKYGTVR